jgi:signal transduction histidine kinase
MADYECGQYYKWIFVASLVTYSDIKSEIGQVISNLLLNALEATQQGDRIAIIL